MSLHLSRRAFTIGASLLALGASRAFAQQAFFRIGTGGTQGTYFPIGGIIANSISATGPEGVEGLIATANSSNGSLANINAIQSGASESGFTQSDVAAWAHSGTGLFEGKPKVESLRLIATLFPETLHIVARADAGIKSVADLKGKRVSIDEPGSGTIVDARIVLGAYGITESDITAEYLKPGPSGEKMRDGGLDAFFFVGGFPAGAITELAASVKIALVPVGGPEAEQILVDYPFFTKNTVPADTYQGVPETETISVAAQWVTSDKQSEELVYNITKALFSKGTLAALGAGHAKGKEITVENAATGAGIPFHAGAEKYYREVGALK